MYIYSFQSTPIDRRFIDMWRLLDSLVSGLRPSSIAH
jgi:hypothetical protein